MQAVEATGEAEWLVYKPAVQAEAQVILPITGYVVILHGNFVVHGQEQWQGAFVSYKYRDHSLWDIEFLVEMLQYFLKKAEARSIPHVDEFAWRMVHPVEQHLLHCDTLPLHPLSWYVFVVFTVASRLTWECANQE